MPQRFNGMSGRIRQFGHLLLPLLLLVPLSGYSQPGELSQSPLFLNTPVQHNLMLVADDSWHMDLEFLSSSMDFGGETREKNAAWLGQFLQGLSWDVLQDLGDLLVGNVNYGYLFESFTAPDGAYNGQRLNGDYLTVPPTAHYAFLRSAAINPQYYNPAVTYDPWIGYDDAPFGDPYYDPNYDLQFGEGSKTDRRKAWDSVTEWTLWGTLGTCTYAKTIFTPLGRKGQDICDNPLPPLAQPRVSPFPFSGGFLSGAMGMSASLDTLPDWASYTFDEYADGSGPVARGLTDLTNQNAACELDRHSLDIGNNNDVDVWANCVLYTPATYYVPVSEGSHRWGAGVLSVNETVSCSDLERGSERFASILAGTTGIALLQFYDDDGDAFDGALSPDGQCLKRVVINNRYMNYNAGTDYERSFEEELQNFSNWFQYHRRRHQSTRYALGESLDKVNAVYADVLTVNDTETDVAMLDTSDRSAGGDLETLLEKVYHSYDDTPASNESPLRTSLAYVGDQFARTDDDAPIQYACQQNYALLYSDGYAADSDFSWSGTTDNAAPEPFGDSYSNTLADVAYGLRRSNLRPDLDSGQVRVPVACADDSVTGTARLRLGCDDSDPHLNTITVSLGGTGDIYGQTHQSVDDAFESAPEWADVDDDSTPSNRLLDDFYHAAVNGLGEAFTTYIPDIISDWLNQSLQDAAIQQGSAAAVAFNSASVGSDSRIFSASFNASNWSGRLIARELNSANGRLTVGDDGSFLQTIDWEAGDVLTNDMAVSDRNLVTWNGSAGVEFTWANLTDSQKNDLKAGGTDAEGQERLAYHQGVRSLEGSKYRTRASLLGDIVYSAPVMVSQPRMGWPDVDPFGDTGERYSHFRADHVDRAPTVYVGANDGMLHAFNATLDANSGGQERFAYIPGLVFDEATDAGLSYLTEPDYEHRYYVDLSPAVSDAYFDSGSGDAWHTVLIGGLRAGGKGLFALDITDPVSLQGINAPELALWEFTDERLGLVTEPVNIALVPWGNNNYEWVVIVGNGYNATTETTGLFLLKLEGGLDGVWTEDTDYQYIELAGAGSHGLTSDVRLVDLDDDRVIDRIYAGDLEGNLWVLVPNNQNDWASAYKQGNDPKPLFTADSGQAITAAPMVVRNPYTADGDDPNLLVLFGTGQYLTSADLVDTSLQSFYGVWDNGSKELERADLLAREIAESSAEHGLIRNLSSEDLVWGSGNSEYMGWYLDFDTKAGERVIQTPQVRNRTIIFNTTIPAADDPCGSAGSSFRMFVDLDGTDPDRAVFDLNADRQVNNDDTIIAGFYHSPGILTLSAFLGDVMFDNMAGNNPALGQETNENVVDFGAATRRGRISWRELIER